MPTYDYSKLEQTALELITKFGQLVTLTRITRTSYNPATGDHDSEVTTTDQMQAAVLTGSDSAAEPQKIMSDRPLLIASKGVTIPPEVGDTIEAQGSFWNITTVAAVNPGGTVLIWKVGVNRV